MGEKRKLHLKKQAAERIPGILPEWCRPTSGKSFNEIMDLEWEELVIRFDKKKNDYVFETACSRGAYIC